MRLEKTLHIIKSLNPDQGGPMEGILRQSAVFGELGVETVVAHLDPPDALWLKTCALTNIPLGIRSPRWRRLLMALPGSRFGYSRAFVRWLRNHAQDFDVVIVHGLWNFSVLGARLVLVAGSTPYVVYTHGMLDPWFRATYPLKHFAKRLSWLLSEGPLLNNADAVIFTTCDEERLAQQMFRPFRIKGQVVPFGTADVPPKHSVHEDKFHSTVPALGRRAYLLFLSRLHPKKGCDILIQAFARFSVAKPELHLVMAGPDQMGWQRELASMAERLGVADRIHWPGMLEGDAKWGAFYGCEAFILPSHSENFGIVAAEAMGCGKPILISDKLNIWQEVTEDGAALVAPDTVEGTEALLERFWKMPNKERTSMGIAARASFLKRYDIAKNARFLLSTLQDVIARRVVG